MEIKLNDCGDCPNATLLQPWAESCAQLEELAGQRDDTWVVSEGSVTCAGLARSNREILPGMTSERRICRLGTVDPPAIRQALAVAGKVSLSVQADVTPPPQPLGIKLSCGMGYEL